MQGTIEDQVILCRQALEKHPIGSVSRPAVLHQLAVALFLRFNHHARAEDLDEAITHDREAYDLCTSDHPDRFVFMNSLALRLIDHFFLLKRVEDLDDAARCYSDALLICPKGHESYGKFRNNIAMVKSLRFDHFGNIQDLHEAISHYREALEIYSFGNPHRLGPAVNLGTVLKTRFEHLHQKDDLEESLCLSREALILCPTTHSYRHKVLVDVATSLYAHFELLNQLDDLNEAIDLFCAAVKVCPPNEPNRSPYFTALARVLTSRFDHLSQMQDLEDAVQFFHQALELRPANHPERASCLRSSARSLTLRFKQTSCSDDLERAISYNRDALTLHPLGHPEHITSLISLAEKLPMKYLQNHDIESLKEAITLYRQAMKLCSPCHPLHIDCLHGLGYALQIHGEELGESQDLESSILYLREAAASCPPSRPDYHKFLITLSNALTIHVDQGHIEDLEEMVDCERRALAVCPSGHPDRAIVLSNTGTGMYMLFQQHGRIEDLEAAISFLREGVDRSPSTHLMLPDALLSFACVLSARFARFGRVADINDAMDTLRRAIMLCPPTHRLHSSLLTNLAATLIRRFDIGAAGAEDLDEAIERGREAAAADNGGFAAFEVLGSALNRRYERCGSEDSEEAVALHRKALALCPPEHRSRSLYLNNLAVTLTTRFNKLRELSDLEEAINYHHQALDLRGPGHPDRAASFRDLAMLYSLRYDQSNHGFPSDLEQALKFFEAASNDQSGNPRIRASVAAKWASFARKHSHPSALSAYSLAMDLLDRCILLNPSVDIQHIFLSRGLPSLSLDAASCAIEQGELELAVEMLERGRALLWSRMHRYRHSLEDVYRVDEHLAREFGEVCDQLEHLNAAGDATVLSFPHKVSPMTEDERWKYQQSLSSRWDDLISRIRKLDGLEDFLKAAPFTRICAAAVEGPVIMVNISSYRSDALIINANSPTLVPLSMATPNNVTKIHSNFHRSCSLRESAFSVEMRTVLRILWKYVVSPVVTKLKELGIPSGSRIWWCPTSTLCALPLHAAGPHIVGHQNLADTYISSYTPTLSALIRARENIPMPERPSLLAVGQLDSSIPMVEKEIRVIEELGSSVHSIVGESATPSAVIDALQTHPWVHFACHGRLNLQHPFESSFRLHNKAGLTLRDIMQAKLPNAELAFLSACHSATGGTIDVSDEVLHLAAAIQFCGFRSVVGTLWEMQDKDGPELAREFYTNMFTGVDGRVNFKNAAKVLHAAVRSMSRKKEAGATVRASAPASLVSNATAVYPWITFIHIGA